MTPLLLQEFTMKGIFNRSMNIDFKKMFEKLPNFLIEVIINLTFLKIFSINIYLKNKSKKYFIKFFSKFND